MARLPADVILLILSYLPLFKICRLLKSSANDEDTLIVLCKQELISRMKREAWTIELHRPPAYFAILCNREMAAVSTPVVTLICTAYNTRSEYLRFETLDPSPFAPSDEELELQSMRLYCSHWINMFGEDDTNGQIKLAWRQGSQTKQMKDIRIDYTCSASSAETDDNRCSLCSVGSRCNKHTFTTLPTKQYKQMFEINSMQISLSWIRQGLMV